MCFWDHLDCKHDWTLWGPLIKCLRSLQTDSEISSGSRSRPASHIFFLAFRLVTTDLEASAASFGLFAILVEGAVSSFTERLPRLWTNTLPMVLKAESKTVIPPRASSLLHSLKHFAGTLVWEDDGRGGMLRRWWLSWSLKQILSRNFMHTGTRENSWKPLWNSCCCVFSGRSDCVTPLTVAPQTPVSMEFSTQEYWSGLPFPTSGDLPDPGI